MDLLLSYAPLLARGALTTLALALISLALATFLGAAATLARLAGGSIGGAVTLAYTTLVRGVPDLVMMLIVYFGGQRLINALLGAVGGAPVAISAFSAGVLAIGFIYGAYLAETSGEPSRPSPPASWRPGGRSACAACRSPGG